MVEFICGCGRSFKNAGALATHLKYCKKADQKTEETAGEMLQRLDDLSARVTALEDVVKRMNELVELVVGYVCPAGKNLIGVYASRVIGLSGQISALEESIPALKAELTASQEKRERELKSWLVNVLPLEKSHRV